MLDWLVLGATGTGGVTLPTWWISRGLDGDAVGDLVGAAKGILIGVAVGDLVEAAVGTLFGAAVGGGSNF